MARLVIGLGTSHSPMVVTDAPMWEQRAIADHTNPELYDIAGLLDLPPHGRPTDPATVRSALGPYLDQVKEPRPEWIAPNEPWPPDGP